MRLSHLPLRLTTGAFILNSGLSRRELTTEAAQGAQSMAGAAAPPPATMSQQAYTKALATGEIALGAALLAPFVSPVIAGAGLVAFSGALLRMWWRTPGMHEEGSIRPTEQGMAVAKDVWLLGAGTSLLVDGVIDAARRTADSSRTSAGKKLEAVREALPVG